MSAKRLTSQPSVNPLGEDPEAHMALKTQADRSDSILPHTPEAGDSYYIGDIYDDSPLAISQEWEIDNSKTPYLAHIKSVSTAWPHLRYLADFMEVSTTPLRWKFLRHNVPERLERSNRTSVACLDFLPSGETIRTDFKNAEDLENAFGENIPKNDCDHVHLRLFIVEDLSRHVIETLGTKFDLDPAFFREHINDYSWYNTRDRWMDPPSLDVVRKEQNWFQLRFVRPSYYRSRESFERARTESNRFNVLRRPDDDQNHKANLDAEGAVVGLTRTRASFWFRRNSDRQSGLLGILLLDPTIQEGFSLWRGYRNWDPTPSMHCLSTRKGPPRTSLFEDTIYWMLRSVHLTTSSLVDLERNPQTIVHPVLQLICAEWLTMNEYIKTRLGQIEWELAFPERFLVNGDVIDTALTKLHTWRRLVPLYREMLSETLERAFNFTLRSTDPNSNPISLNNENGRPCAGTSACGAAQHQHIAPSQPPHNLRPDFEQALSQMQEFQLRIDRLTSVVTAAMSIDDSRRGLQESRNVARLTWLATIFIPLSFVSSFYSMQGNIADLKDTFGWYFATAVPLSAFTLLLAWTLSTGALIGTGKRAKRRAEEASR